LPEEATFDAAFENRPHRRADEAVGFGCIELDLLAPIPGTKRVSRVEENTAADGIELSAQQIERLNNLTPATGERHEEVNLSTIDR
jgi:diketogulonate reductase-like aldo/keto reductase